MEDRILSAVEDVTSEAEVYSESATVTRVGFTGNRCHVIEEKRSEGVGLRVIRDGRMGFSFTTAPQRLDELVEMALATARQGDRAEFVFPPAQVLPGPETSASRIALLPAEWMKGVGDNIVGQCEEAIPDLTVDLSFEKVFSLIRLANSKGFDASYEKTVCWLDFHGLLKGTPDARASGAAGTRGVAPPQRGGTQIHDFLNFSRSCAFDVRAFISGIAERTDWARTVARIESRKYPCIFTHAATLDLLDTIAAGVNGKNLERGSSPLIGKEMTKVLDERLTILDDGLRDFGFGTSPFDGEGVPRQTTPLFEHGVFRNFLFDLKSAAAANRRSTGNAVRDYASLPFPSTSNLVVRPSKLSLAKAIAEMREGLVIYTTEKMLTEEGTTRGDFSLEVLLGFKVEQGEVVGRVDDAMVTGNIYEAGQELVGLGDTAYDFGRASAPFFYFPALSVDAREETRGGVKHEDTTRSSPQSRGEGTQGHEDG
jgi:PmbA protein